MNLINKTFLACTLLQIPAAAATILGPGHLDIRVNVDANGAWTTDMKHDGSNSGLDPDTWTDSQTVSANTDSVIFIAEEQFLTRPLSDTWDFLGTSGGEKVWVFPADYDPDVAFPGFNTENTLSANLGIWLPAHEQVNSGQWIEIRLLDAAYSGEAASANFSLWTIPSPNGPMSWMSTANGVASDGTDDVFLLGAGGHSHMNWGFSEIGIYDLTFQGRTILASGEESLSDPFTLRFGVGATTIPEPAISSFLCVSSAFMLVFKRRRGLSKIPA